MGRESETGAFWGTSCEREDSKVCAADLVKSCTCHSSQLGLRLWGVQILLHETAQVRDSTPKKGDTKFPQITNLTDWWRLRSLDLDRVREGRCHLLC